MIPAGWVEALLLYGAIPLMALTYDKWSERDALVVYSIAVLLIIFAPSIFNLFPIFVFLFFSMYRLHQLSTQTPRASVNPTPSEGLGVG